MGMPWRSFLALDGHAPRLFRSGSRNDQRLRFFEKDTVQWGDYAKTDLYQTIYALNHESKRCGTAHTEGNLNSMPSTPTWRWPGSEQRDQRSRRSGQPRR